MNICSSWFPALLEMKAPRNKLRRREEAQTVEIVAIVPRA
jgi:hypothetical protein